MNLKYYKANHKAYINETISCDVSFHYDIFLKYVPEYARILDIGFGSRRDMFYFESKGIRYLVLILPLLFIKT